MDARTVVLHAAKADEDASIVPFAVSRGASQQLCLRVPARNADTDSPADVWTQGSEAGSIPLGVAIGLNDDQRVALCQRRADAVS